MHIIQFSLQVLFLNNNKIKTIKKNCMLPKLEYLRIEENAINDWDSINSLNEYPNLSKLRCKNNPIFEGSIRCI